MHITDDNKKWYKNKPKNVKIHVIPAKMIKLNLVAYYQFYQLSTKTTYAIGPVSSDGLSGWVRYDILVIFWVGSSDPLGKVLQMIRTHPKGNRLEHALN